MMSDETIICEQCGTENSIRRVSCEKCGAYIRDSLSSLEDSRSQTRFVPEPDDFSTASTRRTGRAYFGLRAILVLRMPEIDKEISFEHLKNSFTLGRRPETQEIREPHIDLTGYQSNIKDQGVSRKHARITRINATLVLEDLGALNGTYVNRERISPVKPCVLCDGDEIRLGNFALEVIFKKEEITTPSAQP